MFLNYMASKCNFENSRLFCNMQSFHFTLNSRSMTSTIGPEIPGITTVPEIGQIWETPQAGCGCRISLLTEWITSGGMDDKFGRGWTTFVRERYPEGRKRLERGPTQSARA